MVNDAVYIKYLTKLDKHLDKEELICSSLPGFCFPNNFSLDNLFLIKNKKKLDKETCKELCFAIYECGYSNISKLSFYNKLYLISILFICNRITKCWFGEKLYCLLFDLVSEANKKGELNFLFQLLNIVKSNKYESFDLIILLAEFLLILKQNRELNINELEDFFLNYHDFFENKETEEECYRIFLSQIQNKVLHQRLLDIFTGIGYR